MWGTAWQDDADGDGVINLLDPDADNDGIPDGVEHSQGSDPADPQSVPSGGSITLFKDDFQRADAGVVGNGWVEVESSSRTRIVNGRLVFNASNDAFRPLIRHTFPAQSAGEMVWTFNLNFQHTGPDNDYSFWMQLGEGALLSNTNPTEPGVAVNLIWGSPSHGLTTHEGPGYVVDGTVTQVATVSGGSVPSHRARGSRSPDLRCQRGRPASAKYPLYGVHLRHRYRALLRPSAEPEELYAAGDR
jgi:hypothetical protein